MREQSTQRLSYASFFGYFLVWYKKVTAPYIASPPGENHRRAVVYSLGLFSGLGADLMGFLKLRPLRSVRSRSTAAISRTPHTTR